jgi:DNA-binding NarL/FixJ family response regulator
MHCSTQLGTKVSRADKKRILIVDDHPLVREWLGNLINQQSDLSVCAESDTATHALQAARTFQPDVALVDISLKGGSGIQLIKDLKERQPEIAVLVLSMHEERHLAERAVRAGAAGYIVKRESTTKVIDAIRKVLSGCMVFSASVAEVQNRPAAVGEKATKHFAIEELSDRELEVFELLGKALGTRAIAETLHLSIKTVQSHCERIKQKLNLSSGRELVREALQRKEAEGQ